MNKDKDERQKAIESYWKRAYDTANRKLTQENKDTYNKDEVIRRNFRCDQMYDHECNHQCANCYKIQSENATKELWSKTEEEISLMDLKMAVNHWSTSSIGVDEILRFLKSIKSK